MVPVYRFFSASFTDIATGVNETPCSGGQDGPGASYCYSADIVVVLCCIIVVSWICTLLRAILLIRMDKYNKKSTK